MLNKNDPLIGAVQEIMKRNQAEREAAKLVNEKFGVSDRKALPHERQGEWDAAYKQVLSEGAVGAIMKGTVAGAKKVNDYVVGKTTPDRAEMNMQPPHPKPKADLSTKVTGGQGIQGYDKQSRSAGPTKINWATKKVQGDNPKVSMDETLHPNQVKLDMNKNNKLDKQDFKMLRAKKPVEEATDGDTTSPSSMGIKGPDYAPAGTTPNYAKSKEQTVSRAAKTSLPPGTMKEAKVNPYAVGMAAVKKSTGDEPPMEKKNIMKAHKIAKKIIAKKKMNEGFNGRHGLSVTASAEEQAVAEQVMGGSVPGIALRNRIAQSGKSLRFRPRGAPTSSLKVDNSTPVSQKPGINAATGSLQPTDNQRTAGYNITDVRDTAYGANPTAKKLGPASSTGGSGVPPVPSSSQARPYATGPKKVVSTGNPNMASSNAKSPKSPMAGQGTARPLPKSPMAGQGTSGVKKPTTAANVADKPKLAQTTTTTPDYDKMSFKQAFASARKQAGGAGGKFKYKGKEYQTNIKGEKYQAASKLKSIPASGAAKTTSVTGGQGVTGFSSTSGAKPSIPASSAPSVSAGPARPDMVAATKAAGQMAVDRMKAQNLAKSQTSSMTAGMSKTATAPAPKSTPPKPLTGGAGR